MHMISKIWILVQMSPVRILLRCAASWLKIDQEIPLLCKVHVRNTLVMLVMKGYGNVSGLLSSKWAFAHILQLHGHQDDMVDHRNDMITPYNWFCDVYNPTTSLIMLYLMLINLSYSSAHGGLRIYNVPDLVEYV